ncbi:LysR family transcriptional regulator [Arthrobacter sp. Br18]|uniref:LysR family transcriptional regulator n=1 Tax=Arthrobacter sp. Br18 TaxID=1312954 RepID=UPI000479E3AE|nr:LysR family transcriptional regulator [Arthrobacter sp. Br18]
MTLSQLNAFLAVYSCGSISKAARELFVSQASVSESIARLEEELGIRLFLRSSQGLVPAAAADELRPHALDCVNAARRGSEAVKSLHSLTGGVSTFGVLRYAANYDLANLVVGFHEKYPDVRVRMIGLNSELVAQSISSGEIECGLVVLPVSGNNLRFKKLAQDEVRYFSTTREADAGAVTIEEFAAAKLVLYDAHAGWNDPTRRQLRERASLAGLTIEANMEVEHAETAYNLVAAGAGDSMMASGILRSFGPDPKIRSFPFSEPLYDIIALVQREHGYLSPATRRFAALAERAVLNQPGLTPLA